MLCVQIVITSKLKKNVQFYATATGMFEYNTILAWYHLAIKRQDAKKGPANKDLRLG